MLPRRVRSLHCAAIAALLLAALPAAQTASTPPPVRYAVSFPAPHHHYAEVEATFAGIPARTLEIRMSRSSPGRYALHEFAKNVFDVHAADGAGRPLAIARPDPHGWDVDGHDGTVQFRYKVFGNRVDGTYLAIDASHAHMNMPATLVWARGLEMRPVQIAFVSPEGLSWKAATQLFPTSDPWRFTAPNLQYLMDSPTELSDHAVRTFPVRNPDGRELLIRLAVHHDATEADVDELATSTEQIVREQAAIFGEYPEFETGTYTFIADYLPWGGSDGMEHRNSTIVAQASSLRGNAQGMLGTISHEFFHAWNVERIRPASLEPFDFERANMSGNLWLAEGVTDYYGDLTLARAGLVPGVQMMVNLATSALAVATSPAHRFRSAVEMSHHASFTDAARWNDPTNFSYSFISYYAFGAALALALDLELRQRSQGRTSLDDYMRALWHAHGKPGGSPPGLVMRPYTHEDAQRLLADVSDVAFARDFFDRHVQGRQVPDYARLLEPAGMVVRKRRAGAAWTGVTVDAAGRVTAPQGLVAWGSPAFDAGLSHGDVILTVAGRPYSSDALRRKPRDRVTLDVRRVGGATASLNLEFGEDPQLDAVPIEQAGGRLTAAQKAFREAWLGPRVMVQRAP